MNVEIIDFHTHPFIDTENNICALRDRYSLTPEDFQKHLASFGIHRFCGAVIGKTKKESESEWDKLRRHNDEALRLHALYGKAYVPGFHIHPDYVEESIAEIARMKAAGVRLIGQLIPSYYGWTVGYTGDAFSRLLDEAEKQNMIVSLRVTDEDEMDELVKNHPNLTIVGTHPGEYNNLMRHIARMQLSQNYYLDISGVGITRYGALKRLVDTVGAERLLFGSNFPSCDPAMHLGAVLTDQHLTDAQKEQILSGNAKRLLEL